MCRVLVSLAALLGILGVDGLAQQASPVAIPTAGCAARLATPVAAFQTVNVEIAVELDRLFGCLAVRDWESVASFVAIPRGRVNPFSALAELDATGLFLVETSLDSMVMRSTGPSGASVDLAWRVGSQVRYDRWTFQRREGRWRVTAVGPGVPQFDGTIIGITGHIGPDGVELSRTALINPGGVEMLLAVAPDAPANALLLVFAEDACAQPGPSRLTAVLEVDGDRVTLSLDGPDDGAYALVVVSTDEPLSRSSICAASAAVLTMTS